MQSMTGYGRASAAADGREITVELKSVNHRFLDINIRLYRSLGFLEDTIRTELQGALSRGHVDVYLQYKNTREDARDVTLNEALASAYKRAFDKAAEVSGLTADIALSHLIAQPDVLTLSEREEDQEAVKALLVEALGKALAELIAMRGAEGERMKSDLLAHAGLLEKIVEKTAALAPGVVTEYRDRLRQRMEELLKEVPLDEARLVNEVAFFADRCAIDEELARLKSHIEQFRDMLSEEQPVGRKLDFIVQEMNREMNTIASKASNKDVTAQAVEGKSEIEKLREQVQNIE